MFLKKSFFSIYLLAPFILFSQTSIWDTVESMGRGLNLGNTLSAPVEGYWAPIVHEQYFIEVSNAGFSNVRIPIDFFGTRTSGNTSVWSSQSNTYSEFNGYESDFVVSNEYLNRVETVVDWSLQQGLYTIIDIHGADLKSEFLETFNSNNSNYTNPSSAKRAADLMKFKSIWIQIANRFINHPEELLFEVVNEPYFEVSSSEMDSINLMIIEAIRSTGGNNTTRPIIITGGTSTSYQAPTAISDDVLNFDSNLIASFHYYKPFNFTASSREEYNDFNWGNNSDKSTLDSHFDEVKSWSENKNIPITLGEFGADNQSGLNYNTGIYSSHGGPMNNDRVEYHRYIAEQAINRGFSFSAWCAGNKSTKTIHLRNDNPSTNNAISGIWVNDVKEALLADGTWPECYGPYDNAIIRNPNFECGVSSQWNFSVQGNAEAILSNENNSVFSGSNAARIDVTTAQNYNKVMLSNVVYEDDLTNKTLVIGCYAKSLESNISFKLRIRTQINGIVTYQPSQSFELSDSYQYYEFQYDVSDDSSFVQLQVLLGAHIGTYFLDSFSIDVIDSSLGIISQVDDLDLVLYPNPTKEFVNIKSFNEIESIGIYNMLGRLLIKKNQSKKININKLSSGFYLVKVKLKNQAIVIKKISKK
tara:strand:+ start:31029 stop:32957 length:1929 start_codon:yes stop_codon:yes gene_type:complete